TRERTPQMKKPGGGLEPHRARRSCTGWNRSGSALNVRAALTCRLAGIAHFDTAQGDSSGVRSGARQLPEPHDSLLSALRAVADARDAKQRQRGEHAQGGDRDAETFSLPERREPAVEVVEK